MGAFRGIQFDVVIAQDARGRVARGLVQIDEGPALSTRAGRTRKLAGAYHTSKTAESSGGEVAWTGLWHGR